MIFFHVLVALTSVCLGCFATLFPSKKKIQIQYVLLLLTLGSGGLLVLQHPFDIGRSCVMGTIYLLFIVGTLVVTKHRLAEDHGEY